MDIREYLPEAEKELLLNYLECYNCSSEPLSMTANYFLREWAEQKKALFSAFGNQFIVSKSVVAGASSIMLTHEMSDMYSFNPIFYELRGRYDKKIHDMRNHVYFSDRVELESLMTPENLANNIYSENDITIPAQYTTNGKPFVVKSGCKIIKTLAKLIRLLDCDIPIFTCKHCKNYFKVDENPDLDVCPHCSRTLKRSSVFEEFRLKHSQILNQKKVVGELCLSIHPMDYLTMSDNDCGWNTCMSWVKKAGEYRLGTIEMMNSPSVIVAYLKASHPFETDAGEWNNKKWRQLIIVDPAMIVGNRQYPDNYNEVSSIAMEWVKDLIQNSKEFNSFCYEDEMSSVRFSEPMSLPSGKTVTIQSSTNFMYNDLYAFHMAYINIPYLEQYSGSFYTLYFSGAALCANCGKEIMFDDIHPASSVCCRDCCQLIECCVCGNLQTYEEGTFNDSDEFFCYSCWDDLTYCDYCHDRVFETRAIFIAPPGLKKNEVVKGSWPAYCLGQYCDRCVADEIFGPVESIQFNVPYGNWTRIKSAIRLENLEDDYLDDSCLSVQDIEKLTAIQAKYYREKRKKS